MKKKIILAGVLCLIILSGFLVVQAKSINNSNENQSNNNVNVKSTEYSLDELYNFVKSNNFSTLNHENIGYIYTHFYEYFNHDTKFLVISKYDSNNNEVLETKYITYDEYMEKMQPIYDSLNKQNISKTDTIWNSISLFLINYYFTEYV